MATFTAADVPGRIDVLLDGQGYLLADQVSSPVASAYGLQRATFGNSPVFVTRQNVSGDYGDNQQDSWLTFTQKDWSGGEQAKYEARGNDPQNRYWVGNCVDVSTPGEVSMRKAKTGLTFAGSPKSACPGLTNAYVSTTTTLYHVDYAGTITSDGAHGLGAAPSRFGMTAAGGGVDIFLSTTAAGTVGVRRWNGAAFATYSATPADSLATTPNTLYGFKENTGDLMRYDSAGVATSQYTWRNNEGVALTGITSKLVSFGAKLLILRYRGSGGKANAELWLYDGVAPAQIAEFPSNFNVYDMEVVQGVVYISGAFARHITGGSTLIERPAIYFYKDGTLDVLWKATGTLQVSAYGDAAPALATYDSGLVFTNSKDGQVAFYDPSAGAVNNIQDYSTNGLEILTGASSFYVLSTRNSSTGTLYPASSDAATTSSTFVNSSLVDFDTSLRKIFRGVRIEFDSATTGDGGSADILYRFNDVLSGYTSLQTGAVSGTEYLFPTPAEGTNYRSVSIQIALNKGTSTNGPVLRRIQLRAMPTLPVYKHRSYTFMLGGRDGKSPVKLRDQSFHPLDGKDMALNLQIAAARSSPFSITDHLGTYTGIIEENGLEMVQFHPEQWVAHVKTREV
jgi:hypothetical protein